MEDEMDEYGRYPWRTEVVVTDPLGARIQVSVTAPRNGLWGPQLNRDAAEIAAHAAHQAMARIHKIQDEKAKECPF
jgi:hypothetical protein